MLAAALWGAAEALEGDGPPHEPEIEEAPDPSDGRWLVWLDREDPSRSLVIVPARVVMALGLAATADPPADRASLDALEPAEPLEPL